MTVSGSDSMKRRTLATFLREFEKVTGLCPRLDEAYSAEASKLVEFVNRKGLRPLKDRRTDFFERLNWKFRLNAGPLASFYAAAAKRDVTFHYHEKQRIDSAFNRRDIKGVVAVLAERGIDPGLVRELSEMFLPVGFDESIRHLTSECREPSKLRKSKAGRDIEGEILRAQFASFLWSSLPERDMHEFFDRHFDPESYRASFWEELHTRSPHLFSRRNALHVVRLSAVRLARYRSARARRDALSGLVGQLYAECDNYGFVAFLVEPFSEAGCASEWEVAADLMLYAEKHQQYPLDKTYFRWQRVQEETQGHVGVDPNEARFELVNEGFTYRDCFVLTSSDERRPRLLLVFQKNQRDETVVPCPACRSSNVQGNSYPSLGVRSWECKNVLCPDRSKYNRGKRYSFKGLLMQEAIEHEANEVPRASVQRWLRDVVANPSAEEVQDMLVRHYSMAGDCIHSYDWDFVDQTGTRTVESHELVFPRKTTAAEFWDGPMFSRYVVAPSEDADAGVELGDDEFRVVHGDAARVLRTFGAESVDGAVTSPPYYNAREYAQWPNMYCYLHDMFAINREVFRVLKPGAYYYYNIFDYFDNERTVVFSAMGDKRLVLSAYTIDLFRRIGFRLAGNVVWDKGDIEGKRGFNGGNFSPFYQAPFNCWEHVLVFQKPGGQEASPVSEVLEAKPVFKMVRGENKHGHTAPFPEAIPRLLLRHVEENSLVLDPFGGSMTTGRAAEAAGVRSVCIEQSEEYCNLGLALRARLHQASVRAVISW